MSCCFPISSLNKDQIDHIQNELTIRPTVKPKNPFVKGKKTYEFQKKVEIELFDIDERSKTIYLPFAYVYHHLSSLYKEFPNENIDYPTVDYSFEGKLLDRQKAIRDSTLEIINRTRTVLLSLYTGFGKTIYALYLTSKIGLKTVVLCHRKIIMDQWVSSIEKYLPEARICVVEGNKLMTDNFDIYIMNVINVPKKHRTDYRNIGLVIIDECHTICTESYCQSLFYFSPKYMIALSATPDRTDGMDLIVDRFIGPERISIKMNRLFNVYRVFTKYSPEATTNARGDLDWNACLEQQATDERRNNLICNLVKYFSTRNILVLCKRKDHARRLAEQLRSTGEDVDVFYGTQRDFNCECRILVSSYSKSGTGFDFPKLDMLITAADVLENFVQYLGRIFRKSDDFPIYIDLVDKFKPMYNHSRERCEIAKNLGGDVKNFDDYFDVKL
jgi:superfamily II DNA or RNA helicase